MKPKINYPTQEQLKARFSYYEGVLHFRKNGRIAGTKLNTGYIHVGYKGSVFLLHRLIYIYHYGAIPDGLVVDHIDGDKNNNRIENLQAISQINNIRKQRLHKRNTTGFRGCVATSGGKFKVQISTGSQDGNRYVGTYPTLEEAAKAYNAIAKKLFGEFAVLNPV